MPEVDATCADTAFLETIRVMPARLRNKVLNAIKDTHIGNLTKRDLGKLVEFRDAAESLFSAYAAEDAGSPNQE